MSATLIRPVHRWWCPKCRQTDVTHEARPHSRMHPCPGLRGLSYPFLPYGTKAKVEVVEPEDYVRDATVRRDPERGRPVAGIVTTRDNGSDAMVFPQTATIRAEEFR